jgi:hypothetical protein
VGTHANGPISRLPRPTDCVEGLTVHGQSLPSSATVPRLLTIFASFRLMRSFDYVTSMNPLHSITIKAEAVGLGIARAKFETVLP